MTKLILPRQYAQMSTPIVFWYSKSLDHIMNPPHHSVPAPEGYQRVECRHAHEVDKWSARLRSQEQRIREMTEEERYNFEEPIRVHGINCLRKALAQAKDQVNRTFISVSIAALEQKRELKRKEHVEYMMHCESKEGVAS